MLLWSAVGQGGEHMHLGDHAQRPLIAAGGEAPQHLLGQIHRGPALHTLSVSAPTGIRVGSRSHRRHLVLIGMIR
jgi:hypothetical protein